MTNKEIQQLINKYLEGETSPEEERQLALAIQGDNQPEEWQAIRMMLGELTIGEAEYDAIMEQRKEKPSAILIALRTISSIAAIYLVGLFFWLQQTPELTETAYNTGKPTPTTTSYCTEGTPREILMCYLERRKAQPHIYQQLKQKIYENQ